MDTVTQTAVVDALNQVRNLGIEFTKAFNNLAELVETLAGENANLKAILHEHDKAVDEYNQCINKAIKARDEAASRADKAERDAWEFLQRNEKLTDELRVANTEILDLKDKLETTELNLATSTSKLASLANLQSSYEAQARTITDLRAEVSKLLDVILTVATSVDVVVGKAPKQPEWGSSHHTNAPDYPRAVNS